MSGPRLLERVTRNAAMGLRFWDAAGATSAIDGLRVEVFPLANLRARTRALPNPSGVYVAHTVRGQHDFEFHDDPATLWTGGTLPYRVEVRDPFGRFLPMAFTADLPARNLFTWVAPWLSPPSAVALPGEPGSPPRLLLERVPLFSAPSRPVPEPLAVLRAQLREDGTADAAAWVLIEVAIEGVLRGLGLSDAEGRVAVMFPYPEPPRRTLASPPEARDDYTWQVALRAFAPQAASPRAVAPMADLEQVLASLATPRTVIESRTSPAEPLRLTFREPLTVRTAGGTEAEASFLFVSA